MIGPPEAVSKQLLTQLISDMERQQHPRCPAPGESAEYTLRGYVVSSLEKKGSRAKISYIWDVTDGSGKGVHRVSGEETAPAGKSPDPWTAGDAVVIEAITARRSPRSTAWLPPHSRSHAAAREPDANSGLVQTAAATPVAAMPAYPTHGGDNADAQQHRHNGSIMPAGMRSGPGFQASAALPATAALRCAWRFSAS